MCGPPAACQQRFNCIKFGCLQYEACRASWIRRSPSLVFWAWTYVAVTLKDGTWALYRGQDQGGCLPEAQAQ